MILYWLLFGSIAAGALLNIRQADPRNPGILFQGAILLIVIIAGLRYQVGGDWDNYYVLFRYTGAVGLARAIDVSDPAYQALNWLAFELGGSVVAVNLACAVIFAWGLQRFARSQQNPWMSLVVAVPYLVIVVAMGYTRQATAIGILMAGLASLLRGRGLMTFTFYVVAAALFHKTAVVMLPFAVFAVQRNRLINLLVGAVATYLLYRFFLADALASFVEHYLENEYSSQGALIRVMMSFIPALIFFSVGRRLGFDERQYRLWWIFSATSVAMLILLFVLPSSTAVDRLALYLIPLQLVIVPRAAGLFSDRRVGSLFILLYAAAVLFVWLNFSAYSNDWIPYRFAPFT